MAAMADQNERIQAHRHQRDEHESRNISRCKLEGTVVGIQSDFSDLSLPAALSSTIPTQLTAPEVYGIGGNYLHRQLW